jgi:hypothetical protein
LIYVAGCRQKLLARPLFPPQEWAVRIDITLSDDLVLPFLKEKPSEDDFFSVDWLPFWLQSKGALHASIHHPVITGDLADDIFDDYISRGPVVFVPLEDQKLIYAHSFKAAESFDFANNFVHSDPDASGVDVKLELEVNGRSIALAYQKIQPDEKLPPHILMVLASIRRNLPSEYDRLFDFLKVPKLLPLPSDQVQKYAKCRLHDEWMKVGDVPFIYGLLARIEDYDEAEAKLFPNANRFTWGGCVVHQDSPKKVKRLFCSSCRAAEKKWVEEYKSKYLPSPSGAPELPHGSSTSLPKKLINNP